MVHHTGQLVEDHPQPCLQVTAQQHRVATGDDVAHTLVKDRLKQHGRGRRPVADFFVQAPQQMAHEHGAHVLVAIGDLDDTPDDHAAAIENLGHPVGAGRSLQRDDARKRSQGRPDRCNHLVDTSLEPLIGSRLKNDALGLRFRHQVEHLQLWQDIPGYFSVTAWAKDAICRLQDRTGTHYTPNGPITHG